MGPDGQLLEIKSNIKFYFCIMSSLKMKVLCKTKSNVLVTLSLV